MAPTTSWRIGFYFPAILAGICITLWATLVQQDSIFYLIDKDRESEALVQFQKVYDVEQSALHKFWEETKEKRRQFQATKKVEPNVKIVFADRKYQAGTLFLCIGAVINQCSGINAINVYSTEILGEIPGIPVTLGVYLLASANVVGALIGPPLNRWFSIKQILIVASVLIAIFDALVFVFQLANMPTGILASMIIMIIIYQATNGSFFFVYVS